MANDALSFTLPVGRIVWGNPLRKSSDDGRGGVKVYKSGANIGKPKEECAFGIALPKEGKGHFSETSWGAQLWAFGHAAMPQLARLPHFAWKIVDGDSTALNQAGRRPCDAEGYPGHFVLALSTTLDVRCYVMEGGNYAPIADGINAGDYVGVKISVGSNTDNQKPGIFLNPQLVCLFGKGVPIVTGPNVAEAGFEKMALPPGAQLLQGSAGVATPPPPGAPAYAPPGAPAYTPPAATAPAYQPPPPAAGVPVTPNPAFLNPPTGLPAAPTPPPPAAVAPPPAAPARVMTAAANGATYEAFIAQGWNDAQLIASGYMLP